MEGCLEMPGLGGLDPPSSRLHIVLLSAFAIGVHQGYGILSRNISLFRGLQRILECEYGIFAGRLFGRQILPKKVGSPLAKQAQRILVAARCLGSRTRIVILFISS